MENPASYEFEPNSGSVSSGKLDKAVSFQVAGSGGVARFSIAAFALQARQGGQSSRNRVAAAAGKQVSRAVDRGFKRRPELLKIPPGAPSLKKFSPFHGEKCAGALGAVDVEETFPLIRAWLGAPRSRRTSWQC